jgi:hypothetical protein
MGIKKIVVFMPNEIGIRNMYEAAKETWVRELLVNREIFVTTENGKIVG